MYRRTFIRGGSSIVAATCVAGCTSTLSTGTIELHALNWSTNKQTLEIRIKDNDQTKYHNNITLPEQGSIRKEDILNGGAYTVVVTAGDETTREHEFEMGECKEQELTVIYEGPTELEIRQNQC